MFLIIWVTNYKYWVIKTILILNLHKNTLSQYRVFHFIFKIRYDFHVKPMLVRLYSHFLLCMEFMLYLCYLYLLTYICMQHDFHIRWYLYRLIDTTGITSVVGTAYPSGEPESTPVFPWGSCYSKFNVLCIILSIIFCLFVWFLWPLYCVPFKLRLLITIWHLPTFLHNGNYCPYTNTFFNKVACDEKSIFHSLQKYKNSPLKSTSFIRSTSSLFSTSWPKDFITVPSSLVRITPVPPLSYIAKTCLIAVNNIFVNSFHVVEYTFHFNIDKKVCLEGSHEYCETSWVGHNIR